MNKKSILAAFLLFVGILSLIHSKDLEQKNPETIFLTHSGLESYKKFEESAPNSPLLILKVSEAEDKLENVFNRIKTLEENYTIISPLDLAPLVELLGDDIDPDSLPFKLFGEDFFAFIIKKKASTTSFKPAIRYLEEELKDLDVAYSGIPFTNYKLDEYSKSIRDTLFPLMFALSFILLLILTRKFLHTIILFLPCLFSAALSLSAIKLFYSHMNMVTSIVPLIAFTINLSLMLHLYYTLKKSKTVLNSLRFKKEPIFLMLITTSIGFGSLFISEIPVIRDFSLLSSGLILLSSTLSLLWFFSIGDYLKSEDKAESTSRGASFFQRTFSFKLIFSSALIFSILAAFIFPKIPILTDATSYFPKSSEIKTKMDEVSKTVTGMPLFDILITKETPLAPILEKIKNLDLKQDYKIVDENLFGGINDQVLGKKLSQLRNSMASPTHQRVLLLGTASNYLEYNNDLQRIKEALPLDSFEINGLYYNLMKSQKSMIDILYQSLLLSLFVIAFLAFLYTRKVKVLFIFLFVNIIPVLISLNLTYVLGYSINIATIMTYSISLGIIVDSSFHLLHILRTPNMSFQTFYQTTVKPILLSSIVFILCFSTFMLNEFVPIHQFGFNLSLILFLGLIFDLFILPTLYLGHPRLKEIFKS